MLGRMVLIYRKSDEGIKYWVGNQMMNKTLQKFIQFGMHNLCIILSLVAEAVICWYYTVSYSRVCERLPETPCNIIRDPWVKKRDGSVANRQRVLNSWKKLKWKTPVREVDTGRKEERDQLCTRRDKVKTTAEHQPRRPKLWRPFWVISEKGFHI